MNLIFQTKHKTQIELNFFENSDIKKFYIEPDVVKYKTGSKPQYDLILGTERMKELGIVLDFKTNKITIDEVIFPMRSINHLQGTSMLHVLRLNNSLAMEPNSTQDTTTRAMRILHGGQDDSILSAKLIRIAPETSSF